MGRLLARTREKSEGNGAVTFFETARSQLVVSQEAARRASVSIRVVARAGSVSTEPRRGFATNRISSVLV